MPGSYTYPGVYIQEISSGVHTITGVSTSVTAFAGWSRRGPVNAACRVFNFSEYTRLFGGLDAGSEMGYAVRQFFLNGGSEAWIVRVAKVDPAPQAADNVLPTAGNAPVLSLKVEALYKGDDGNAIEVQVDHATPLPDSTFNLTFIYDPVPGDSTVRAIETFSNLSMNRNDPNFVEKVINRVSRLVTVTSQFPINTALAAQGTFTTGEIDFSKPVVDSYHNSFLVVVDGQAPVPVAISNAVNSVSTLQAEIQGQINAQATCSVVAGTKQIRIQSNTQSSASSVRILAAPSKDLSNRLRIDPAQGAKVVDAASLWRPDLQPKQGTLTSGAPGASDLTSLNNETWQLNISLDNLPAVKVPLSVVYPSAATTMAARMPIVAQLIEQAVKNARRLQTAYSGFTCQPDSGATRLVLTSGTFGAGSAVLVSDSAAADDLASLLKLTAPDATAHPVQSNFMLQGGVAEKFDDNSAFNAFIPVSPGDRFGINALDEVQLFNLMCLPGISDPEIIDAARVYCETRRAFLIVDPPPDKSIDKIQDDILVNLPKTANAALYYPWVDIADPLNHGRPRFCPPSGTIAGLYARTDASRGVWKAPAGIEATLAGVQGLQNNLTDEENGVLNVLGVNCLRKFTASGIVSWGARSLRGNNDLADEYKYIPVRRLALFIEESLYRGLKWVVFEPNDEPLWSQIRLNVGSFMNGLFRNGAFQGKTPREAYLVKCDSETTTQGDINNGIVNILVGFAPLKPAEFVILQIQQLAGQINA